jgi:hypothetical protein
MLVLSSFIYAADSATLHLTGYSLATPWRIGQITARWHRQVPYMPDQGDLRAYSIETVGFLY